jgi:hypothetical protein
VFRADGRNSTGQSLRYHVRLWQVRGTTATVTVGAVHHEARVGFFEDRIDNSWEESEEFLRAQLCTPTGCPENPTLATQSGMQAPNPATGEPSVWWRGWYNDARPTVFTASAPTRMRGALRGELGSAARRVASGSREGRGADRARWRAVEGP